MTVTTAHTADVAVATLAAAKSLLEAAFEDWTEADWEHSLGGIHALAWEDGELVGQGSLVQRRLLHRGRALRAGYLEGLAVRADRRGRGHGAALVAALERAIRSAYDLGALSVTDAAVGLYVARGWEPWRGTTAVLAPEGIVRTPEDDGGVYVLRAAVDLDLDAELACDWRDGDVW